jgi:hypothetical protein
LSENLEKQKTQVSPTGNPGSLFTSRQAEESQFFKQGLQQREGGHPLAAIDLFQRSLSLAQELKDSSKLGTLIALVETYDSLKDFVKAAEYSRQIVIFWRERGDSWNEARELADLGNRYLKLGDFDKAIYYGQQAVAIARGITAPLRTRRLGNELTSLGLTFFKSGKMPEAEKTLLEGLNIYASGRMNSPEGCPQKQVLERDAGQRSEFDRQFFIFPLAQKNLVSQKKIEAALEIAEQGRARVLVNLLICRLSPQMSGQILATSSFQIEQMKKVAKTHNATLVEYSIVRDTLEGYDREQQDLDPELYIWVIKPTGEVIFKQADLKSLGLSLPELIVIAVIGLPRYSSSSE